MSFDKSWNVEKYKSDFESDEHWELRKNFMLAHKEQFSEERLVCLAQVFFNVEFLGCKYPDKTMKLVQELSNQVAAEHRELKKAKIQRTFVKASDAASARIKGAKHDAKCNSNAKTNEEESRKQKRDATVDTQQVHTNDRSQYTYDTLRNRYEMTESNFGERHPRFDDDCSKRSRRDITLNEIRRTTGPCGNIVVFFKEGGDPQWSLQKTAQEWNKVYKCVAVSNNTNHQWVARIMFDGVELSSSSNTVMSAAKKRAAQLALEKLMKSYFTIKIKHSFCGGDEVIKKTGKERIDGNEKEDGCQTALSPLSEDNIGSDKKNEQSSLIATDIDTPLEDSNVGLKLLKMMGWSGGGLGKNQQGISEPIKPSSSGKMRAGFGSNVKNNLTKSNIHEDLQPIKKIIKDYKFSTNFQDLVFSPEFTKEQRSVLHQYAQKLGLKTKSFGGKNEENRHLVIFKRINNWTIIDGLVKNVDQFYNKYELLRPGEHTELVDDAI